MDVLLNIGVVAGFFYIIYMANQAQVNDTQTKRVRSMLYLIVILLSFYGLMMAYSALLPAAAGMSDETLTPQVEPAAGMISAIIAGTATIICIQALQSRSFRVFVGRLTGADSTFNPDSIVHLTGIVMLTALLANTFITFVLIGGIEGLAESWQVDGFAGDDGVSVFTLLFQMGVMVAAAFLAVGTGIRRDLKAVLERLALRMPTEDDVRAGIGTGVMLYGVAIAFGIVWQLLAPPEVIDQQTRASQQLAASINTLALALLISTSAGVGEEILMRGALQPVFGIGITSLFFTLLHSQYLLTPTTLLIFTVSAVLGWLRKRHSTTAAIIAHFVYNLIQLVLLIISAGSPPAP